MTCCLTLPLLGCEVCCCSLQRACWSGIRAHLSKAMPLSSTLFSNIQYDPWAVSPRGLHPVHAATEVYLATSTMIQAQLACFGLRPVNAAT